MMITGSDSIEIPLMSAPRFNLMFLSMDSSRETQSAIERTLAQAEGSGESLSRVLKDSAIRAVRLNEKGEELFFDSLSRCNLAEVERAYCRHAKSITIISAVRSGSSFFAPFWACHAVAQDLAQSLNSIVIDLHQGNIRDLCDGSSAAEAFGIPLTGTFLTVKAYPKDDGDHYFLSTEGMTRFGLPELRLPEVPANLALDGAYLLRAIAQFLWSKLERIHPEQPYLVLSRELSMPAYFCEYGNPAFHAAEELSIPFALQVGFCQTEHEIELLVENPESYSSYCDWYLSVTESIIQHRLAIQQAAVETFAQAALAA